MTEQYDNYKIAAQEIIARVGKVIVIGVPLGIGKPIGFLNALYQLATENQSINLTIITGLTLSKPNIDNELEQRLAGPIIERLLTDYEDPLYEKARVSQTLPNNIKVIEFFLAPGKFLHNSYVQQNYISGTYTSAVRDTLHYNLNVFAQLLPRSIANPQLLSLSSNSDLFHEITEDLKQQASQGKAVAVVAEINQNLPFMLGRDAEVTADLFTEIIDTKNYKALFALPYDELSIQDHLIGLYASSLVKDGGSLQIGFGKLSNAFANALILRHKNNGLYQDLIRQLALCEKFGDTVNTTGSLAPFKKGLYAPTEMLSDEYLQLYQSDILKRRVYDHAGLQLLLNNHIITEVIKPETLDALVAHQIINPQLSSQDIAFLRQFGIFKSDINYQAGNLLLASGEKIPADLTNLKYKQQIIQYCLGESLISGKVLHAGFFLGTNALYQKLRDMPVVERELFAMTSIARTNSLLHDHKLAKQQRLHARFVNTTMKITLGGSAISDGLNNFQEISGVGGQFDFVNMAANLTNARSIVLCHSTRVTKRGIESNIVWNYANATIPRYLRDIYITEYGIADCRCKTDTEVMKALLNITDSRFQETLLKTAKQHGKIPASYQIPARYKNNFPDKIGAIIHEPQFKNYCKPYPFGSNLTDDEMRIKVALIFLKNCSIFKLFFMLCASLCMPKSNTQLERYLIRMQLLHPKNMKEFFYRQLLKYVLVKKLLCAGQNS